MILGNIMSASSAVVGIISGVIALIIGLSFFSPLPLRGVFERSRHGPPLRE